MRTIVRGLPGCECHDRCAAALSADDLRHQGRLGGSASSARRWTRRSDPPAGVSWLGRPTLISLGRVAHGSFPTPGTRPIRETARVEREPIRCWPTTDPAYIAYHDEEWGRPVLDERGLYERLCLEGFQAGLAWITILRKREAFRRGFAGFDPERVARFGEQRRRAAARRRRDRPPPRQDRGRDRQRAGDARAARDRDAARRADVGVPRRRGREGAVAAAEERRLPLRRPDDGLLVAWRRAASSTATSPTAGCATPSRPSGALCVSPRGSPSAARSRRGTASRRAGRGSRPRSRGRRRRR